MVVWVKSELVGKREALEGERFGVWPCWKGLSSTARPNIFNRRKSITSILLDSPFDCLNNRLPELPALKAEACARKIAVAKDSKLPRNGAMLV
jgi:hypothetical protein